MLVVEDFQKFAGIPCGISRIFESFLLQQICANRRKNRSIQVKTRTYSGNVVPFPGRGFTTAVRQGAVI